MFQDSLRATYSHKKGRDALTKKVTSPLMPLTHPVKTRQSALQAQLWPSSPGDITVEVSYRQLTPVKGNRSVIL